MNAGCAGKTEIPWERVPYLSALEVCLWRGAIQIHAYLYLYLYLELHNYCQLEAEAIRQEVSYYYSHIGSYILVLNWVTRDDLEPYNRRYFASFYRTHRFGAKYVRVVKVRPILSVTKRRQESLLFGNVWLTVMSDRRGRSHFDLLSEMTLSDWARFNVPPNTIQVISGTIFTGHMTKPTVSKHWRKPVGLESHQHHSTMLQ